MADQVRGRLSPWLRERRISAARTHLHGAVLDVGCGAGALADLVPPERYLGVDPDADSLAEARRRHPGHRFARSIGEAERGRFDTVASLAVVEHVPAPLAFVGELAGALRPGGRIVLTTPHRSLRRAHEVGARLGLFSREARDEHETLFDESSLRELADAAGLVVLGYRRFLLGANQLLVAAPVGGEPA